MAFGHEGKWEVFGSDLGLWRGKWHLLKFKGIEKYQLILKGEVCQDKKKEESRW